MVTVRGYLASVTRRFEVFWAIVFGIVIAASTLGVFRLWDESGPIAAAGWFLFSVLFLSGLLRAMGRLIVRRGWVGDDGDDGLGRG